MKLPIRGFNNVVFQHQLDTVNLSQIEAMYEDGETVNVETLRARGFLNGKSYGIKILGNGELAKKVSIEAVQASQSAKEKLNKAGIKLTLK